MLSRLTRLVGAGLVVFSLSAAVAFAQGGGGDEEIKKAFWDAIKAFDGGDYAGAVTGFQTALNKNPSPELTAALRDEVGEKRLADMYAKGGDIRNVALRLLQMAQAPWQKTKHDPAEIDGIISKLDAPSFDDWWVASNRLMTLGQWAAPGLVGVLGNEQNDNWRAKAIVTLTKMGDQATLPLMQAMKAKSPLIRKNAAMTLGAIGDLRALPALRRAVEDPAEASEVKSSAAEAIANISKKNPNGCPGAKELYLDLADKFYQGNAAVLGGLWPDSVYFHWNKDTDKLEASEVPSAVLNQHLALQACYEALALDQGYRAVYPVLISAAYALALDANAALELASKKLAAGEGSQEDVDKAKAAADEAAKAKLLGPMAGKADLYAALQKALREKNGPVAEAILKDLRQYVSEDDLPKPKGDGSARAGVPLIQALIDEDKRVRYNAALVVAGLDPKADFLGSGQVVRDLADAVAEQGMWTVLVADPSPEVRNQMTAILRHLNCNTIQADGPMEALTRARRFPGADLIVLGSSTISHVVFGVQLFSKPGEFKTESVFETLKTDLRTKDTPIFLLADDKDPEKGAFSDKVQAVLSRTPDEPGVKAALVKVFDTDEAKKTSKAKAEAVAQAAAEALARINVRATPLRMRDAVPSLCDALFGRNDAVRIPAAKALAHIGHPSSIGPLVKAFSLKDASKEFRITAGHAAARVFDLSGTAPNDEVFIALTTGATEETDNDIAAAAADALGASHLTPEQKRAVFEARRTRK